MFSEGFSALEKNAVIYPQRAVLPIPNRVLQPSADCNGRLAHFFYLNLLGLVWEPTADYICCLAYLKI
jgi:hypothetical protein